MKLYSKRHENRLQDAVVLFKSPVTRDPALRRTFYCPIQGEMTPHELKVYVDDIVTKFKEAELKPFVSTYIPLTDTNGDEIKTEITFATRYDEKPKFDSVFEEVMADMEAKEKLEDPSCSYEATFYCPSVPDLYMPSQKKMEEVSFASATRNANTVAWDKGWVSQRAVLNMNGFTDEDIDSMSSCLVESLVTGYQDLTHLLHNPK